jgi:UDP-GlcNAc:undecaprenyl-phosphate GlcNAc-1-phosphate transferase
MNIYIALLTSFLLSLATVPIVKRIARRYDIISYPKADRWHSKPIPLLGGSAIYVSTILSFLIFSTFDRHTLAIIIGGTVIFVLGLIDDFKHLTPPVKLIVEITVASFIIALGLKWELTGNTAIDIIITMIWTVGITNAFNLLDNMDGLSAGVASITGIIMILCLFSNTQSSTAILLISLIGATLGFLVYNFNPASIFMGDSGSLFIGFMLSSIVLVPEIKLPGQLLQIVILPVLIFLIPIFDTSYVVFTRKLAGVEAMKGGKDHTSHRLVKVGLSERGAVLVIYIISILSGILAYLGRFISIYVYIELIFLFTITLVFLGIYLSKIKLHEPGNNEKGLIPIIVNISYKRRLFEIMLDLVIIFVSIYGAYILRFEGHTFKANIVMLFQSLPLILGIQIVSFYVSGIYKGVWKYTGTHEIWTIIKGVVLGVGLSMLAILAIWRFENYSRTVFIIYAIILFILMALSRYTYKSFDYLFKKTDDKEHKRVLIYGAGDSGEFAVNEILNNEQLNLTPVCFIDDDNRKHGRSIHGYPVVGSIDKLEETIKNKKIDEVIISTPKIKEDRIKEVKRVCDRHGVGLKRFSLKIED